MEVLIFKGKLLFNTSIMIGLLNTYSTLHVFFRILKTGNHGLCQSHPYNLVLKKQYYTLGLLKHKVSNIWRMSNVNVKFLKLSFISKSSLYLVYCSEKLQFWVLMQMLFYNIPHKYMSNLINGFICLTLKTDGIIAASIII